MLFARISPAATPSSDSDVPRQPEAVHRGLRKPSSKNYADPVNAARHLLTARIFPSMLHQSIRTPTFSIQKSTPLREDNGGKYYGVGMTGRPT